MSMIDRLLKFDDYLQAYPDSRYVIKDKQGTQRILTGEQLLEYATKGDISYLSYGSGNFIFFVAKDRCKDKDVNFKATRFEAGGC